MSTLPPIGEISRLSKRRKLETASLLTSYEALCNVDLFRCSNSMIDKLNREVKETWLVAKFGLVIVNEVCGLLRMIPETTTHAQRTKLLSDLSVEQGTAEELADFVDRHCPHLVQSTNVKYPPFLTPPTKSCYDCSRPLVSNHNCQVSVCSQHN